MKILAIETSCDDTGIAVLEVPTAKPSRILDKVGTKEGKKPDFKVLSNVVSSQIEIHKKYGGVFPMMAQREHQKNLVYVLTKALREVKLLKKNIQSKFINDPNIKSIFSKETELFKKAKKFLENYQRPEIDFIAVTYGPGLEPCLWTGVNFARALSYFWDIPIVPVNHIEAHILVNFLDLPAEAGKKDIKFPAISLIVSGGHTQLVLVKGIGDYKIIGETRDDAAGECFDKSAKILGLGYPGGPVISKIASGVKKSSIKLPRPMFNTKDYDFSFSGLKTAVLYTAKGKDMTRGFIKEMCFEVQQAIVDVLIKKTIKAARDFKVKVIILGGGVSANHQLKNQLKIKVKSENLKISVIYPDPKLSTDNGLMIAVAGYFNKNNKVPWQKLRAEANLRIS